MSFGSWAEYAQKQQYLLFSHKSLQSGLFKKQKLPSESNAGGLSNDVAIIYHLVLEGFSFGGRGPLSLGIIPQTGFRFYMSHNLFFF